MTLLDRRLEDVRNRIAEACRRAKRDPASVTLVAVTKTIPVEGVREAIEAGQRVFGENRVQEALGKIEASGPEAIWHLVGHLQRNKARHAVGRFALVHSVDDLELAKEIDRRADAKGIRQAVLVQANLAREASKHGAGEAALLPLVEGIAALPRLILRGLMIIPPPSEAPGDARSWFRKLREFRDHAAGRLGLPLADLSMGMTDDFEVAIEEGATIVRVGRAIFGER